MGVRDVNKVIIISDSLTGNIIDTIKCDNYCVSTVQSMISDLVYEYCLTDERGLLIKNGYNSK